MNKKAQYKLFVKMPKDTPKHIANIHLSCVGCEYYYFFYLIEDGDIHFGCPNCGLFTILNGPFVTAPILN